MKNKTPILSVTLYIFSALFAIYTVFALTDCFTYVRDMMSSGQLMFSDNIYGIVSFFMSNCANYIFFCLAFLTLGRILHICFNHAASPSDGKNFNQDDDDEDLADWFKESK